MIVTIDKNHMEQFQEELALADTEYKFFTLNKHIEKFNFDLYSTAVATVAESSNPIQMLIQTVEVEQIRKVNESQQDIQIRSRNTVVTWSDVAYYIRTRPKQAALPTITLPLSKLDYALINVYGANLVKSPIPRLYMHDIKALIKLNEDFRCFLSNSNIALEKQLNIIFDMISDKCHKKIGEVKARKYNSRLIRMEYLKYSSLVQNFSIVDIDRLIDLILRQYIHVLTQGAITATSKMDIHEAQIPTFGHEAQAIPTSPQCSTPSTQDDYYLIIQKTATSNPYFASMLSSDRKRTRLGIDVDYTIKDISEILSAPSMDKSKQLWNTLIEYGVHGNSKYSVCKHTSTGILTIESYCESAMYAPNGSAPIQKCPSTLIYLLRKNAWLPHKDGSFYKPSDILVDELDNYFSIDRTNILMQALEIGSNRL